MQRLVLFLLCSLFGAQSVMVQSTAAVPMVSFGPNPVVAAGSSPHSATTRALLGPLATSQEPPFPAESHLPTDLRSRLAEAASDSTLEAWQRDFMLEVARHGAEGTTWSEITPAGTPPSARSEPTAIFDPVRDRMVVFAGNCGPFSCSDVWALSLAGNPAWSEITPPGSPPFGGYGHAAIYDPVRDRMVVFGGYDFISYRNDVWALSLAGSPAWSELTPAGTAPSARYAPAAIYDPVRDRMVVFGGADDLSNHNDVWALSLAGSPAWSELTPAGTPPSVRYAPAAIYDPVRDRMVMFGGRDISNHNDVWALSLAGSPAWSEITPAGTPPSARREHTAIYDPVRDRMVVFGGWDDISYRNDVRALEWGSPVSVAQDLPKRRQLGAPRPNPSRGEVTVDFELVETARVVLDVFDAQGRRVKGIADRWFTAGRHVSTWRGDNDRGHALGSGVYFIRMQVGRYEATRRMVRVQ